MALIVDLTIPSSGFDLGRVTANQHDIHIELERLVPTGDEIMPFFWVRGTDFERFERGVRNDPLVDELAAVSRVGDRVLYHVSWAEEGSSLTRALADSGATILEATGNERWHFQLRFSDHSGVKDFYNAAQSEGIEFHVERLYSLEEQEDDGYQVDLTPEQQTALVMAVEQGYFEIPRGVTLAEIAEQLDITSQAASERIRRGANTMLRAVLLNRSAADFD